MCDIFGALDFGQNGSDGNSYAFQTRAMWHSARSKKERTGRVQPANLTKDTSVGKVICGTSSCFEAVPHCCNECRKYFDSHTGLQKHMFYCHQAVEAMPYQCEECSKGFLHSSSYLRHLKQHKGIYSFTCQVCGKGFYNHSDLKGHLVSHGGDHQFMCSLCGKDFAYRQGLYQHLKNSHQS